MFCEKCGNQLNDNERFCSKCGASVSMPSTSGNIPYQQPAITMDSFKSNIKSADGLFIKLLWVTVGLQVLMIILWFVDCIEADGMGIMSRGLSMNDAFEGVEFLSILTVLACIASLVFLFLPMIKGTLQKRRLFAFQIVMAIWCLGWFLIEIIGAADQVKQYGGVVDFTVTFGGWLFVLVCIAQIIICCVMSDRTKKLYAPVYINTPYQPNDNSH